MDVSCNASIMYNTQINSSPYEEGWMIKVKPSSPAEGLLDAASYTKQCEQEDAH